MIRPSSRLPPRLPPRVSVSAVLLAVLGASLLGGAFLPFPALAQPDSTHFKYQEANQEPTRFEEFGWYKVALLKFQSGKSRKALSMIEKQWTPAAGGAGAPDEAEAPGQVEAPVPTVVEIPQGPWDVMMIYPLEKRPVEMKWKSPAELAELRKAFREALGEEEAEKTWKECKRLIARSTSFVGFSGLRGRALTGRFSPSN